MDVVLLDTAGEADDGVLGGGGDGVVASSLPLSSPSPSIVDLRPGAVVPASAVGCVDIGFGPPLPSKLPYNICVEILLAVVASGMGSTSIVTVAYTGSELSGISLGTTEPLAGIEIF